METIGRVLQLGTTEMAYLMRLSGVEDSSGPVGVAETAGAVEDASYFKSWVAQPAGA